MDDNTLELIASNNPALTMPGSMSLSLNRTQTRRSRQPDNTKIDQQPDDLEADSDEELSKYDRGWRRVLRNFSPSWFSVTMGTGVVSLLFINIPFRATWLYWFSVAFFILNLVLFSIASVISILRYTLYPAIWTVMIHDPNNSLFLGTITMGAATLIESFLALCCPYWGAWATTLAWILWMLDSIGAFAITVSLSFILISQTHVQSLDRITAVQLLVPAATIVASGTGAGVAHALIHYTPVPRPHAALGTLITSYVMWGMSTTFAMVILVIYWQRLAVHKLPPRELIVSSFLPLGPLGMGGYTIMYLGSIARDIIPLNAPFLAHVATAPDILYVLGIFIALMMWAFGLVWLVYALGALWSCWPIPFTMGWWGFTFPLGVMAISTIQLGVEFPSLVFRVLGTIFGVMVMILWAIVFAGTIRGALKGQLLYAPCLKNLPNDAKHGACVNNAKSSGIGKVEANVES